MKYKAFSLCMGSLHFPRTEKDRDVWEMLSSESSRMLEVLYQTLNEKIVSARDVMKAEKMLEGSIFCCCLPEGMAMLRCKADGIQREMHLDGFIVMKESLRTAWHLSRWKLLFACSAGWKHFGMNRITLDEINQMAISLHASQEMQKRLIEMSQKMLASEIPFSFAITDFPHQALPLKFSEAVSSGTIQTEGVSEIVIPDARVQELKTKAIKEAEIYRTLCLRHDTKRHYISDRTENATEFDDVKQLKNYLKEETEQYEEDEIWYFTAIMNENEVYIRPLNAVLSDRLCSGAADFSELCGAAESFIRRFEKDKKTLEKKRTEKQKEDSSQTEESENKVLGFFKKILRK